MEIISIVLLVILSIVLFILYNKEIKKLHEQQKEKLYQKYGEEYDRLEREQDERIASLYRSTEEKLEQIRHNEEYITERYEIKKQSLEETIKQLELRREELIKAHKDVVEHEQEKIKLEVANYKNLTLEKINQEIEKEKIEKKSKASEELAAQLAANDELLLDKRTELANLLDLIEDYKKKQQVINEEILRRRQVEEQQAFYRIELSESAIQDMQILLSIRQNLKMRENLDKLIYEAYVSKPAAEMIKRVLSGRAPSGIYKITRLKTGEIYIGKSTDVKKRWSEHAKTSYGVGSIAHSILHTTIKKDGIENFTFELLEEVPKDKLTEREKYWITFYGSKEYGLNERNG